MLARQTIEFSPKAESAMRLALGEAKRLRQNRIGVEQVLIGLIAEETSFAGQILKSHGVTLRDAKRIVEASSLPGVTVTSDHIPINSAVENLFAQAFDTTLLGNRYYLTTDRLLLLLLDDSDKIVRQVFAELYVDIPKLRSAILDSVVTPAADFTPRRYVLDSAHKGFERFSNETMAVFLSAQAEALRLGQAQIGGEVLLFGICDQRTSRAAEALKKLGVTPGDLRIKIEKTIQSSESSGTLNNILLSANSLRSLRIAFDAALVLGDETVSPVHLLASILFQGGDFARSVLTNLSVNIEKLESLMLRSMVLNRSSFIKIAGENIPTRHFPSIADTSALTKNSPSITSADYASKPIPLLVDSSELEVDSGNATDKEFRSMQDPERQPIDFASWQMSFKAMRTLICAEEEALHLHLNSIGSAEILLGLMAEGTSIAAIVLRMGKFKLRDARPMVAKMTVPSQLLSQAEESTDDITYNSDGMSVVDRAKTIANKRGEFHIRTAHLLLAIIDSDSCLAMAVLKACRLDIMQMKVSITELLDQQTGGKKSPGL